MLVFGSALILGERISAAVPITAIVVLSGMAVCVSTRGRTPEIGRDP